MKNYKVFSFVIALALCVTFLVGCAGKSKPKLYVFNWGDYINTEIISDFEKEFDCKVVYRDFATNEDLYVKITNSKDPIDVIFPSEYMFERMKKENLLEKIDTNKITNLNNLNEIFSKKNVDPSNEYSVPYFWGTVGIVYNSEKYPDGFKKFADLWDEKYAKDIVIYNSQRDVFMMALRKLGYSMNTRDRDELEKAKEELMKQKPLVYGYLGDEIKDVLAAEEANIGLVYSGDAGFITNLNSKYKYVLPEEGTNLWFDVACIPKQFQNKELAEEFLNYLLRPEVAAKNAEYLQYATPVTKALELLPEELVNNKALYPDDKDLENTEVFHDISDIIKLYDEIWTEFTSGI